MPCDVGELGVHLARFLVRRGAQHGSDRESRQPMSAACIRVRFLSCTFDLRVRLIKPAAAIAKQIALGRVNGL